jgi:hypothetical protein
MKINGRTIAIALAVFCATGSSVSTAWAETFSIPLIDGSGTTKGTARIINNRYGPDELLITVSGLPLPVTRYTVFLTQSATVGALPAAFLGEFSSSAYCDGPYYFGCQPIAAAGTFSVTTEVANGFSGSNTTLTNAMGIADVPGAGALANGANTIPLNWIRIYAASGTLGVFGGSENEVGGPLVLRTATAIPENGPVYAYLSGGSNTTLESGFAAGLIASQSKGAIVQYILERVLPNGTLASVITRTDPYLGFYTVQTGCPGETLHYRLTVVDNVGRRDSFDQSIFVTRNVTNGLNAGCIDP